jgi:hypothetical protein
VVGVAAGVSVLAGGRIRFSGSADALAARALNGLSAVPATPLHRAA